MSVIGVRLHIYYPLYHEIMTHLCRQSSLNLPTVWSDLSSLDPRRSRWCPSAPPASRTRLSPSLTFSSLSSSRSLGASWASSSSPGRTSPSPWGGWCCSSTGTGTGSRGGAGGQERLELWAVQFSSQQWWQWSSNWWSARYKLTAITANKPTY